MASVLRPLARLLIELILRRFGRTEGHSRRIVRRNAARLPTATASCRGRISFALRAA